MSVSITENTRNAEYKTDLSDLSFPYLALTLATASDAAFIAARMDTGVEALSISVSMEDSPSLEENS